MCVCTYDDDDDDEEEVCGWVCVCLCVFVRATDLFGFNGCILRTKRGGHNPHH